jgi:hypothetical protein
MCGADGPVQTTACHIVKMINTPTFKRHLIFHLVLVENYTVFFSSSTMCCKVTSGHGFEGLYGEYIYKDYRDTYIYEQTA